MLQLQYHLPYNRYILQPCLIFMTPSQPQKHNPYLRFMTHSASKDKYTNSNEHVSCKRMNEAGSAIFGIHDTLEIICKLNTLRQSKLYLLRQFPLDLAGRWLSKSWSVEEAIGTKEIGCVVHLSTRQIRVETQAKHPTVD